MRFPDSPSQATDSGSVGIPFQLGKSYLAAISRIEALPQNQSGSDKTWVELTLEESRQHFAKAIRVS